MHQSIATINSPEFINLQPLDINPLMSSCEIKVLYVGENRNHSYITKEVATDMAKTLRGAPIVGYYKDAKEDFADHGERVILDDEGVKFDCLTRPYGFVAPDAEVWFQKFEDTDDFGNKIEHEYLMTTGYLWTEQYKECKVALEGRPQSMELDEETLDGHWSTNNKTGMDFFIINDAIFSKLCILGNDVEPCFEGASVTAPDISTSFNLVNDDFKKTLYTMMQELKFALEGGQSNMELDNQEEVKEETTNNVVEENQDSTQDTFAKSNDEEKDKKESGASEDTNGEDNADNKEEEEKKDKSKNSLKEEEKEDEKKTNHALEEAYSELETKFTNLEKEYQSLVEFKRTVENKQKDELIKSFYMLSDEDKADVIKNKEKYSLEDIEAKLSVICVRKKVNFDSDNTSNFDKKAEESITTYALGESSSSVPAYISALKNTQKTRE